MCSLICIYINYLHGKKQGHFSTKHFISKKKSLMYNTRSIELISKFISELFIYWFIFYAWIFLKRIFADGNVHVCSLAYGLTQRRRQSWKSWLIWSIGGVFSFLQTLTKEIAAIGWKLRTAKLQGGKNDVNQYIFFAKN